MSNKFLKAADNARRELILGVGLARTILNKCSHFQERPGEFQHFPTVTMTPSQLAQTSPPPTLLFYMYSVRKHHQRYLKNIQYSEWVSVPCVEKKDPRVAVCRVGNVPNTVLQSWGGAWNGNQCYSLWEPGSPLPSIFFFPQSNRPSIQLRVRWQHEELEIINTTTLTHRPHSTRVYYHTTIFQPNTVNGERKGFKQGSRAGSEEGSGGRRGRGGRQREMKHILTYAYVCDRCLHDTTTDNHHTTFSLSSKPSFHCRVQGDGKAEGSAREVGTSVGGTSCSQHKRKMAVFRRNKKKRSKKQANLLINSHEASWIFNRCSLIHPGIEAAISSSPTRGDDLVRRICSAKVCLCHSVSCLRQN